MINIQNQDRELPQQPSTPHLPLCLSKSKAAHSIHTQNSNPYVRSLIYSLQCLCKLQQVFLFVQEVLNPINCCFPCVPSLCIVFCYCENPAGHRIQQRLKRFMGVFGSGGRAIICQLEGCRFDLWPPICIVICMTQNSTENSSERLSVNSNPNGFLQQVNPTRRAQCTQNERTFPHLQGFF